MSSPEVDELEQQHQDEDDAEQRQGDELERTGGDDELADELDHEHADELDGDDGQTDSHAEPAAGAGAKISPEEAERRFKAADKAATAYHKRVVDIFGELADDYQPCPRCLPFALGHILPLEMMPLDDAQREAVRASIGEGLMSDLRPAPNARRCDTCGGRGAVDSGSLVADWRTIQCPACKGRGLIYVGGPQPEHEGAAPPPAAPDEPVQAATVGDDRDPWGRYPHDPDYGVMPTFLEARRARQTA